MSTGHREDVMMVVGYAMGVSPNPPQIVADALRRLSVLKPDAVVALRESTERFVRDSEQRTAGGHPPSVDPKITKELTDIEVDKLPKASAATIAVLKKNLEKLEASNAPTTEKKKREVKWSDEQRVAAAERMRIRRAAQTAESKPATSSFNASNEAKKPQVKKSATTAQRTSAADEYIGERVASGDLTVSDWPDIKRMLANGSPSVRVARSYKVSEEHLADFIVRMVSQDASAAGNR